jgi:hypothetical protein
MLAHQNVRKLDANSYSTAMSGYKFKLAHKRFDKESWSAGERAQKRKLVKLLRKMADQVEAELINEKSKRKSGSAKAKAGVLKRSIR